MKPIIETDVAVVGAGFAGLAAGRSLARAGAQVAVLEARDRVGGRVVNAALGGGAVVEAGGQWIGPTQDRVAALASELEVKTFPTHAQGANLLWLGGRRRRYRGTVPRLGPLVLADVARALRKLNGLARRIDPEAPWASRDAARLDATSLGAWVDRTLWTATAKQLLRIATRTTWGAEPEELSLLYAGFYVRAAGGFEMLTDVEGGAQQDRLVGGSQELAIRAAAQLGDRVVTGAPVRRISATDDGLVLDAGRAEVHARRAIVTVPPPLRSRIQFAPALPPLHAQLAQRMPMGWLVKATAVYEEPFWRADGLSGEALHDRGPVTISFDNSPPGGAPGALVGFVGGSDARAFAGLGKSERRRAVLECFADLFGPRALRAERYLEQDWADEEWSAGGPVATFASGGVLAAGPALREPVGRVHWAGTETATRWAGYIDGAISSGERAAAEVLAAP